MTSHVSKTNLLPKLVAMVKPRRLVDVPTNFEARPMEEVAKDHRLLSMASDSLRNVAHVGGDRSYMLLGSLARLERALMNWSMTELISKHKFTPVVVPNLIHDHIIDSCGFPTRSHRSQVYKISGTVNDSILNPMPFGSTNTRKPSPCIAGTSEFALAALKIGDSIPYDELPKRYCAISRCYRAETSSTAEESGLYRVHYFYKTEMFALTKPDDSELLHDEFLAIQKDLFDQLGLEYRVLDMPEDDLGLSARKKYDIEAWMPGRQRFGEISSTSNCTDYQTSRLNITSSMMIEKDGQLQVERNFVHSVNGTACSSIRTLIAICETHQDEKYNFVIPEVLVPYMDGVKSLPTDRDAESLKNIDLFPQVNKS